MQCRARCTHHHHVYVVELSDRVWNEAKLRKARTGLAAWPSSFAHVGMTGLDPDLPSDSAPGIQTNRFVREYGLCLLPYPRPRSYNPDALRGPREMEEPRDRILREAGYGIVAEASEGARDGAPIAPFLRVQRPLTSMSGSSSKNSRRPLRVVAVRRQLPAVLLDDAVALIDRPSPVPCPPACGGEGGHTATGIGRDARRCRKPMRAVSPSLQATHSAGAGLSRNGRQGGGVVGVLLSFRFISTCSGYRRCRGWCTRRPTSAPGRRRALRTPVDGALITPFRSTARRRGPSPRSA